jgi:predicted enzyme involved in methoxymalonyl-ACP biosynthesis
VDALTANTRDSRKVLVTDLDNVLWAGVVADDGVDGIHSAPVSAEGRWASRLFPGPGAPLREAVRDSRRP